MVKMRIAVVTNVLPHYREAFYRELFRRPEVAVTVYCQDSIPEMNLTTVHHAFPENVRIVRATLGPREIIGWQHLPWRRLLSDYDVLFVYANPRILSNVALASLARLLGRAVVLWGPARSAGATGLGARIRLMWWRCFKSLFVYTDREVEWLRERGFSRQHIVGMNNGLDQRKIDAAARAWSRQSLHMWQTQKDIAGRLVILSCARLEPKNHFALWLEAMPNVLQRFPSALWCVIGDGHEGENLRRDAVAMGVEGAVRWLGGILNEEELAPWFLSSQLLVHPSAIGLTLLHAFGYGLPVITADDPEAQMPEFAAFTAGETGSIFQRGCATSLARAVCELLDDPALRATMAANARRVAREQYNTAIMADRFVGVASSAVSSDHVRHL
jgi:glycosyltransferase involved in cell wall biosynthesis